MTLHPDVLQTIRDGKSIIIEGLHLDPGLYLEEFGKYGIRHLYSADSLLPNQAMLAAQGGDLVLLEAANPEPVDGDKSVREPAGLEPGQALPEDSSSAALSAVSDAEPYALVDAR